MLNKQRYQARLQQSRDATPRDDLGREVTQALRRALLRQIETNPTLTPHSTLHFTMQSGAFDHAFQSATFPVREVREDSERLSTYLQTLDQTLNSNQAFTPDDTFDLETTFIRTPGPGRGHGNRYKPASAAVRGLVKHSVIHIKNQDALCCARALVTMKARADAGPQDHDYRNLRRGTPSNNKKPKNSIDWRAFRKEPVHLELTRFQAALPGYQIKLMSIDPPHMIVFKGETASEKKILLIQEDGHYNGCISFAGFLSKSSYCHECDRGYDHETFSAHPCNGKWCKACRRPDCPEFLEAKRTLPQGQFPVPARPCSLCHRHFFGDACSRTSLRRQAVPLSNDQEIPRLPENLRDQVQAGTTLRTPTQMRTRSVPHLRPTRGFGRAPMLHPTRGPRRRLAQD